jgi:hypothetical protein
MAGEHDPGAAVLVEPTHRTQPRLETAVVGLDVVVGIPIGAMPGSWQQLLQHGGYAAALSVMTSTGARLVVPMARSKNRRGAFTSRRGETNTSMTWLNWSIAR